MNEKVARFGEKNFLLGIVTEPENRAENKPAFIFLNSGLIHRVAPFRFYVWAARDLSEDGLLSLRMDLSGKGDSPPRKNSETYQQNVLQDTSDAMDFLEKKYGIKQFIICGICTGADNTYDTGFHDSRVVGIIPIDGYAYKTFGFYVRKYGPKMLRANNWARLIKKITNRFLRHNKNTNPQELTYQRKMVFPEKSQYKSSMANLLTRGTKVLLVYTGGWSMFYNYPEQFMDAFPQLSNHSGFEVKYMPRSDHTFVLRFDRQNLIGEIRHWTKNNF